MVNMLELVIILCIATHQQAMPILGCEDPLQALDVPHVAIGFERVHAAILQLSSCTAILRVLCQVEHGL